MHLMGLDLTVPILERYNGTLRIVGLKSIQLH